MPTVLLTGANRGLGLEFTHRYLERDWEVFAITRQITPELEMLSTQHALHLVSGDV